MKQIRTILLATDFRPASAEAARVAGELAAHFGSAVALVHAVEDLPGWPTSQQLANKQPLLNALAKELADKNVAVGERSIEVGSTADVILRKAREVDADLILLGAGDRTGKFRISVGPSAETVLEQATQPVLAVRPGSRPLAFRKILCPVDQSSVSANGLRNALVLANEFNGEVVILTVVPEVNWLTAAVEVGELTDAQGKYETHWRQEFEAFVATHAPAGSRYTLDVRRGVPHEQIIAAAGDHAADLITIGATGRTGLVRVLLGSTTRRVIEHLPASMLIVKDEDIVKDTFHDDLQLTKLLMGEGRKAIAAKDYETAITKFQNVLRNDRFHVGATSALFEVYTALGKDTLAEHYRQRAESLRG